jgi:hypothetical protein
MNPASLNRNIVTDLIQIMKIEFFYSCSRGTWGKRAEKELPTEEEDVLPVWEPLPETRYNIAWYFQNICHLFF